MKTSTRLEEVEVRNRPTAARCRASRRPVQSICGSGLERVYGPDGEAADARGTRRPALPVISTTRSVVELMEGKHSSSNLAAGIKRMPIRIR
jgi:hypothetical protein